MYAEEILNIYIEKKRKLGYTKPPYFMWGYERAVPDHLMETWYKEATGIYNLSAHYDVFEDCINHEVTYDRVAYCNSRRGRWHHKQKNGAFRKQKHHKKKVLSEDEIRKREWKKKDPRDQDHKRNYRGSSKWYLRNGHRAERRNMKSALKKGDWKEYGKTYWLGEDQMTPYYAENDWDDFVEKDRKAFIDPWDWW